MNTMFKNRFIIRGVQEIDKRKQQRSKRMFLDVLNEVEEEACALEARALPPAKAPARHHAKAL